MGDGSTRGIIPTTGSNDTLIYGQRWDDATWILTSAFIVFTMQSGFGLLESGSVSRKNEVNIMVKNAVDVIFGGLSYWMFGYGLSFGTGSGSNGFCGLGFFFVDTARSDPKVGFLFSHFFFQTSFATTATTIVSGSMAERTKLEAYIVFSFFNSLVYCIPAHWLWAPETGWLARLGVVDIAGACGVHLVGGITGLVATVMLGPRTDIFENGGKVVMSSPSNVLLGLFMLWWGWLGFNCGSTYGIAGQKWVLAATSAVSTILASIGGGVIGIAISFTTKGRRFDLTCIINGVLGALVSITAYCALAKPWQGLIIGVIGGAISCFGTPFIQWLKIDDPVGVIPIHVMAAVWGMIAVGLFGEVDELENFLNETGLFYGGGFYLLGVQTLAVIAVSGWAVFASYILLKIIDLTIGIRVPLHEELLGADLVEHSLYGLYERKSQTWYDGNGKLVVSIDTTNEEKYKHSIEKLRRELHERLDNQLLTTMKRPNQSLRIKSNAQSLRNALDVTSENCGNSEDLFYQTVDKTNLILLEQDRQQTAVKIINALGVEERVQTVYLGVV